MSKCSVRMTWKLKVWYWTWLRPNWARAAGATQASKPRTAITSPGARRTTSILLALSTLLLRRIVAGVPLQTQDGPGALRAHLAPGGSGAAGWSRTGDSDAQVDGNARPDPRGRDVAGRRPAWSAARRPARPCPGAARGMGGVRARHDGAGPRRQRGGRRRAVHEPGPGARPPRVRPGRPRPGLAGHRAHDLPLRLHHQDADGRGDHA